MEFTTYKFSENTLYIEANECNKDIIIHFFKLVFDQIDIFRQKCGLILNNLKQRYILNYIKTRNRCYAYIVNTGDYNIIIGNNPDGSPHLVDKFIDSSKTPEEKKKFLEMDISDWGDASIMEEEIIGKTIQEHLPIINVPGFIYIDGECIDWSSKVKSGEIAVMKARISDILPKFKPNVLIVDGFPNNTSEEEIKTILSVYSTSIDKKYPIIKLFRDKNNISVTVTYDINTMNGACAKIIIDKNVINTYNLNAKYALKTYKY